MENIKQAPFGFVLLSVNKSKINVISFLFKWFSISSKTINPPDDKTDISPGKIVKPFMVPDETIFSKVIKLFSLTPLSLSNWIKALAFLISQNSLFSIFRLFIPESNILIIWEGGSPSHPG